jgi:hypothetical protein
VSRMINCGRAIRLARLASGVCSNDFRSWPIATYDQPRGYYAQRQRERQDPLRPIGRGDDPLRGEHRTLHSLRLRSAGCDPHGRGFGPAEASVDFWVFACQLSICSNALTEVTGLQWVGDDETLSSSICADGRAGSFWL